MTTTTEPTQDNRPPRYEEDGRIIYRASSLGMCDKVFVALANGYTPKAHPAWFQEILDEGTRNEAVIRGMYKADTEGDIVNVGRKVEMEILDGVWVRGSIDGELKVLSESPILFEAKKIRDSGWAKFLRSGVEVQPTYPMQTAFYLHALEDETGIPWEMHFVGGHYVENEKTGEWSVTEVVPHVYSMPPVPLLAIKKRIAKLERLITETTAIGDLPCNIAMFPCPFFYLHDETMEETPERPGDDIINSNLKLWDELEEERKTLAPRLAEIEARRTVIKDGVLAWLQASGQDSGDVSTVKVDDIEVAIKYLISPRAGYVVEPGEQTRVTIRTIKRKDETVAKAPSRSRAKKASKATDNPALMEAVAVATAPDTASATPTPAEQAAHEVDNPPASPPTPRRKLAPKA